MATLQRILRYTPAGTVGLLVAVWAASIFGSVGWVVGDGLMRQMALRCERSSIELSNTTRYELRDGPYWQRCHWKSDKATYLGQFQLERGAISAWVLVPIPALVLALLPVVRVLWSGPRFRLWHCLAYTALVAVELAYYLRWQG